MSSIRPFLTALVSALACSATPGAAQEVATAQQNLDCAVVVAIAGGQATDEEGKSGIGMLLSYFAGLYEGQTGKKIDDVLADRLDQMTLAEVAAANVRCQERATDFSQRLTVLGKRLQAEGK